MSDIESMTTAELREALAVREQQRENIVARYMNRPAEQVAPAKKANPAIRMVEFEGESYPVDMGKLRSRKFLKLAATVDADNADAATNMELLDLAFGGECEDAICAAVTAKLGYEDYLEVLRIESGLLEAADLKN